MYQLFFDQYPLYDPRDESLIIQEPDVHLAVGEAGEVSFTIGPDHPYADRLTRMKGAVKLLADGRAIFRGRIRKDTRGFDLTREIEAEGLLACLNDSYIPPFEFPGNFQDDAGYTAAAESGNVVQFFLGWLLDQHNAQVGPAQRIQLGTVTVADPNNYISRASSDYLTTMEVVRKKLEETIGGYLVADYSGETTTLHYYAELPLTNTQDVEFGKNLLDLVSVLDSMETYTAILPLGKDGLTIAALPDGELSPGIWKEGLVIYSQAAEETVGGRITKKVEWKDVTIDTNLETKALAMLTAEGVKTEHTITVKAVDLGPVENVGRFDVGRLVRLNSTPHGFSLTYPLMELDPDILDPANTEITMGGTTKTATGMAHGNLSATQEKLDQQQMELNQQKEEITQLPQSFQEQVTSAVQSAESIIFSALDRYVETSNFEEFKQTVSSEMEVMADNITLRFTEATERIEDVNGDLQQTNEVLLKHFEFTANGLAIKAGEGTMTLRLDNDLIIFERNGQQFGHWDGVDFHTGNIIIEVNERAQLGNFAAVPRASGNLSWMKVRG